MSHLVAWFERFTCSAPRPVPDRLPRRIVPVAAEINDLLFMVRAKERSFWRGRADARRWPPSRAIIGAKAKRASSALGARSSALSCSPLRRHGRRIPSILPRPRPSRSVPFRCGYCRYAGSFRRQPAAASAFRRSCWRFATGDGARRSFARSRRRRGRRSARGGLAAYGGVKEPEEPINLYSVLHFVIWDYIVRKRNDDVRPNPIT